MATKRKDPAAVKLGRKGGSVKGKRRWAHVSPEELSAIMARVARARWRRKGGAT